MHNDDNIQTNEKWQEIKAQRVRVKLTDGQIFRGKINLNSEAVPADRMSDFFLKGVSPFVILFDVTAQGRNSLFIVNKSHILWITPDD
jgi:hypothetical protein